MPKNVIIIGGPTASGKSGLALDLATEFDGVIINADASQVYKGIPIISAAPSAADKARAEHKLYEYLEPSVNGNVFNWLNDAVVAVKEVWQSRKTPIIVGGSGLYLENLVKGTTPIPEVKPEIREQVSTFIEKHGIQSLYEHLLSADSAGASLVNPNDTTRVRRAYEIFLSSGHSIADWYKQPMVQKLPEADFFSINILPPKADLDQRCDVRFEQMLSLISFIKNVISLDEATELSQLHTRQYAKRQLTWFRNKFNADITLSSCYIGQKDFINDVKKIYK